MVLQVLSLFQKPLYSTNVTTQSLPFHCESAFKSKIKLRGNIKSLPSVFSDCSFKFGLLSILNWDWDRSKWNPSNIATITLKYNIVLSLNWRCGLLDCHLVSCSLCLSVCLALSPSMSVSCSAVTLPLSLSVFYTYLKIDDPTCLIFKKSHRSCNMPTIFTYSRHLNITDLTMILWLSR